MNATELLKYAKNGNLINKKRFAYKDIKVGSVVRRKNEHKIIYMVDCFFISKNSMEWWVGGTPPTVLDKVDDIEICPLKEIPSWMIEIVSNKIFRIEVYRADDKRLEADVEQLEAENKRQKTALDIAIEYIGENDSSAIAIQGDIKQALKGKAKDG